MGKYCRAEQATDDNTAHAHCMLDIKGYRHTLTICNTYCFPLQQWLYERASMLRYTYVAIFLNPVIFAIVYCDSDKKSTHIPAVLQLELLNKWPLKETYLWRSFQTGSAEATVPVEKFEMSELRLTLSIAKSMEDTETVLKTFELFGVL